jgi:hypothetical protein
MLVTDLGAAPDLDRPRAGGLGPGATRFGLPNPSPRPRPTPRPPAARLADRGRPHPWLAGWGLVSTNPAPVRWPGRALARVEDRARIDALRRS